MDTIQIVIIRDRPYTFHPERDALLDGHDNRHVGELRNSRGDFAGWVFEMTSGPGKGNRLIQGGPLGRSRRYTYAERTALATLKIEEE